MNPDPSAKISDESARLQASDPTASYIVQAPAGSGKTELLTQRYLRLLATVKAPEHIVALTFTRKAAHEMRQRILEALRHAAKDQSVQTPHQQQTRSFAKAALFNNQTHDWRILQHPNRLRIQTIDALCQHITQAIPLQEQFTPISRLSEHPEVHYKTAAEASIQYVLKTPEHHHTLQILLHHLDNRQDSLCTLLEDLLANRAQWLEMIFHAKTQDRHTFEEALSWIEDHELERFKQSIPKHCLQDLMHLSRTMASLDTPQSDHFKALADWHDLTMLNRDHTAALSALLLTSKETLRKTFDHHVGLKRAVCPEATYNTIKSQSKVLLESLNTSPDFLCALLRVKALPPETYPSEQWQVLQALFTLLPILAAHLNLTFKSHNEVDFTAVSQQASAALGEEDTPTELALYLDHQIHHILVDEFQDTSIQQFQLLEKLVQGWQPDEGKTLFLVGDPMQSIYRFRAAEVGLFLKAKQQGIGSIRLTSLELTRNFRATGNLVDWVNEQFYTIFPAFNDIEAGAVTFHASVSTKAQENAPLIQAFEFENREDEAEALLSRIKSELETYPTDTIAVLVRSRSQLKPIIHLLKKHALPFEGVDLDPLADLPHVQDVFSLMQALLMPANRLSWLAVLRGPWCGVSLSDLHAIANYAPKQSIYVALSQLDHIKTLTEAGRIRCTYFFQIMQAALYNRAQMPLVDWILNTLHQLHFNAILTHAEQQDLEVFWHLVASFEQNGQIGDWTQFEQALKALYSKQTTPSRLQIMTIHKSKGLEFDCVILPSLSAKPPKKDRPLLRWLNLPTKDSPVLLVSPVKSAKEDKCPLYDYLDMLDQHKHHYELQRLLYVAVTRAKKRLYLYDRQTQGHAGSFRHLLQHQPFMASDTIAPQGSDKTEDAPSIPLVHLPLHFYKAPPAPMQQTPTASTVPMDFNHTRLLGIVTHELLHWICDNHPKNHDEIPWSFVLGRLSSSGLVDEALSQAKIQIKAQMTRLFQDPIGQWIIQKHEDEHNEYELLTTNHSDTVTRIIDRTFKFEENRWIIDFKTGQKEAASEHHHRMQVNDYAFLLSSLYQEPIQCGIYYLGAETSWVTWHYQPALYMTKIS